MPGDSAVRGRTSSISEGALRTAFSTRSSVTTSTSTLRRGSVAVSMRRAMALVLRVRVEGTDEETAALVDRGGVPGKDQRGGVHLRDYRRTPHDVAGLELGAVVDVRLDLAALDPDLVPRAQRRGRVLVALLELDRRHVGAWPVGCSPHCHELMLGVEDEGEKVVVGGVEGLWHPLATPAAAVEGILVDRHRDLEALAVVAKVGGVRHPLLVLGDAFTGQCRLRVVGELSEDVLQRVVAELADPPYQGADRLVPQHGRGVAVRVEHAR